MPTIRYWTDAEDRRLADLVAQGKRDPEIASALGRTRSAVKQRRCTFGLCLVRLAKPVKNKRPRTPPETVVAVCDLIESGLAPTAVSRRLGVSVGLVEYYARRDGAVGPSPRSGRDVRTFDADLVRLSTEGLTRAAMARTIGVSESVVRCRLTTLARREIVAESIV